MRLPNVYCMMSTLGKPLTGKINDILLLNAYDMTESGREEQEIKGRGFHGVIRSDLEPFCWVGMTTVVFNAEVCGDEIKGEAQVRFAVRLGDLDPEQILSSGQWVKLPTVEEIIEMVESQYAAMEDEDDKPNPELN